MKISLAYEFSNTAEVLAAIDQSLTIAADLGTTLPLTDELRSRIDVLDDVIDEDDPEQVESLLFIMDSLGMTSKWHHR